jgi:nitrite reductase/ring-hydroxylating ferredoxin subunit
VGVHALAENGTLVAIGSRCSHAGGPLDEGDVDTDACTVQCPWHQSVFRLTDGSVVHGPASVPQAAYDVRIRDGHIEVRHRR